VFQVAWPLEAYQRADVQTLGTNGKTSINATATLGDGLNSTPDWSGFFRANRQI
jgi:hypothetical protein